MLNLPARIYSKAVWETVRYRTKHCRGLSVNVEALHGEAAVNDYTADMLKRLCMLFKPKRVIEIGTYIGKSTLAMAEGMDAGSVIDTCDATTDLLRHDKWEGVTINTHHCLSTGMLAGLKDKADLFFFDGRLPPADAQHIERLSHESTVYCFDDWEVLEKGICNALMLQHLGGIVVPPEEGQTLGMIIRKIGLTRQ